MKATAKLTRIGNSRGIRIPKHLLEACGIEDKVEIAVERGRLVLTPVRLPRDGWAEAFRQAAQNGDGELLLDDTLPNDWDSQWQW